MKRSSFLKFCLVIFFIGIKAASGQVDTTKRLKICVFIPLYLDDAFDGPTYKLGKLSLPKNILPGLEFYNGVMMAADSLNHEGAQVSISTYDTKSLYVGLNSLLAAPEMDGTRLIIAAITNAAEQQL